MTKRNKLIWSVFRFESVQNKKTGRGRTLLHQVFKARNRTLGSVLLGFLWLVSYRSTRRLKACLNAATAVSWSRTWKRLWEEPYPSAGGNLCTVACCGHTEHTEHVCKSCVLISESLLTSHRPPETATDLRFSGRLRRQGFQPAASAPVLDSETQQTTQEVPNHHGTAACREGSSGPLATPVWRTSWEHHNIIQTP